MLDTGRLVKFFLVCVFYPYSSLVLFFIDMFFLCSHPIAYFLFVDRLSDDLHFALYILVCFNFEFGYTHSISTCCLFEKLNPANYIILYDQGGFLKKLQNGLASLF